MQDTPYEQGHRNGKIDQSIGVRSDYAWNTHLDTSNPYSVEYGQGYRDGWHGQRIKDRRARRHPDL